MAARLDGGRVNQKRRTHQAIVDAARSILSEGRAPTVEEAADRALVSRATAYRYFASQDVLLLQASAPSLPDPDSALAPIRDDPDPVSRISFVARAMQQQCIEQEAELRAVLRLSLDRWLRGPSSRDEAAMIRPANRVAWIAQAISPLEGRVPRGELRRLEFALASVMGTESLLALRDVCGADDEAVIDAAVWAAATLVSATMKRHDLS